MAWADLLVGTDNIASPGPVPPPGHSEVHRRLQVGFWQPARAGRTWPRASAWHTGTRTSTNDSDHVLPVTIFSCGVTTHADRPMPWPARTGRGQVSRPRADGSLAECGCLAHWHYRTQNTTSKPAIAHAAGCSAKDSDCGRHCGSDHGGRCALNRHGHSDHRALAGFKSSLRSQSKSPAFGPTCRLR